MMGRDGLGFNFIMLYNTHMKSFKNFIYSLSLASFVFVFPIVSFAQGVIDTTGSSKAPGKIHNPLESAGIDNLNGLIKTVLTGIVKLGVPIVALAIIYAGFLFVFAQGNTEKLDEAKRTFIYTLIGGAILLGAWALAQIITNTVTSL